MGQTLSKMSHGFFRRVYGKDIYAPKELPIHGKDLGFELIEYNGLRSGFIAVLQKQNLA